MDEKEYTEEEKKVIKEINEMTQYQMASLWRFAPAGHPYFDSSKPFFKVFDKRFRELGGMTPEISKNLGF